MYDLTMFQPGQPGWSLTERAAFFGGEGHGDLSYEVPHDALTVTGTYNGAGYRFWKGKARVILNVLAEDGRSIWSSASPTGSVGTFSVSVPKCEGGVNTRITVASFPARLWKVFGAGVVNLG